MDPKATLDLAEQNIEASETARKQDDAEAEHEADQEAREALANYRQWRRNGGFEPEGGDARHNALQERRGAHVMLIDGEQKVVRS
jgi:hypothetical protein